MFNYSRLSWGFVPFDIAKVRRISAHSKHFPLFRSQLLRHQNEIATDSGQGPQICHKVLKKVSKSFLDSLDFAEFAPRECSAIVLDSRGWHMKRGVANIRILEDIVPAIIRKTITIIIHIHQILTFCESPWSKGANGTGNPHYSEILTTSERITTDLLDTFWYGKFCQTRTIQERARHDGNS